MSIGLTTAELTGMRSAINDLLPGTGDIYSVASTADGFGGYTEGTTIVSGGSNVPYRLDPLQGEETLAGGAIMPFYRYQLTIPWNYGTIITDASWFKAGSIYYRVHSIDNANGDKSWTASTRVILERP
jgi:hypothetical protein